MADENAPLPTVDAREAEVAAALAAADAKVAAAMKRIAELEAPPPKREPKREWHKVAFLSPGELAETKVHKSPVLDHKGDMVGVHHRTEYKYHPQKSLGHGYYVVEDGVVVAHVDEDGRPLDMDRVHECSVVQILEDDPFTPSAVGQAPSTAAARSPQGASGP